MVEVLGMPEFQQQAAKILTRQIRGTLEDAPRGWKYNYSPQKQRLEGLVINAIKMLGFQGYSGLVNDFCRKNSSFYINLAQAVGWSVGAGDRSWLESSPKPKPEYYARLMDPPYDDLFRVVSLFEVRRGRLHYKQLAQLEIFNARLRSGVISE
jgi:hypothetical protein